MQTDLFRKPKLEQCRFIEAWVGKCSHNIVTGLNVCNYHKAFKCSCGKQAISNCHVTVGAFVCGNYSCKQCGCPAHTSYY